jgi:hypothetical protein
MVFGNASVTQFKFDRNSGATALLPNASFSGNVGIGIATPSTQLEVAGTGTQTIKVNSTDGGQAGIYLQRGSTIDSATDWNIFNNGGNLRFNTLNPTNTERFRISSGGLVGINEASPSAQLQVKSNAVSVVPLIVDTLASHNEAIQVWRINGSNVSRMGSAGYLATPGIHNLTTFASSYIDTATTGTSISRNVADSNPALIVNQVNSSSTGDILRLQKAGSSQFIVTHAGNVGIGTTTSPSTKLHINGNLRVDGNIQFPATQVASSDANNLDDYEEGDWTPVLGTTGTAPTVSYVTQTGKYTKIGNIVNVQCYIRATVSNVGTGTPEITGLPFSAFSMLSGVSIGLQNIFATQLPASFSNGYIDGTKVDFGSTSYSTSSNVYITFSATYRVA